MWKYLFSAKAAADVFLSFGMKKYRKKFGSIKNIAYFYIANL